MRCYRRRRTRPGRDRRGGGVFPVLITQIFEPRTRGPRRRLSGARTALACASEDVSNASEKRGRTGDGSNVPPTRPRGVHRFVVAGPRKKLMISCTWRCDNILVNQSGASGGSRRTADPVARTHAPVTPDCVIIVLHAVPPCVARLRGSRDPSLDAHGTSSARISEWAPRQG